MMRTIIKIFLLLSFGVMLLCALGLAGLDWYLGSDTLRRQAAEELSGAIGLPVSIDGDLGVSVYPWLGIETEGVRIGQPEGFGEGMLASAASVTAKISIHQLMQREIDFDIVAIDKLELNLTRRDGKTNIDPLLELAASGGERHKGDLSWEGFDLATLTVRGLRLDDCSVRLLDHDADEELTLENLRLRTGNYRSGEPLDISFDADVELPRHDIIGSVSFMGPVEADSGFTWASVKEASVQASVEGPYFSTASGRSHFTSKVDFDTRTGNLSLAQFKLKLPKLLISGEVDALDLMGNPHAHGNLQIGHFMVRETINHYLKDEFLPAKDPGIFNDASLALDFKVDGNALSLTNLDISCDSTRLKGSFSATDFSNPHYSFELEGDTLDFDRYYRLFIVDEPFILNDFGPEFLGSVNADGTVRVGSVVLAGGDFTNLTVTAKAGGGECLFTIPSARLFDGSATGEIRARINEQDETTHKLALSGFFEVTGADAAKLPILNTETRSFSGKGNLRYGFDMPETSMQETTNIDEVIRHTSLDVRYELLKGVLTQREGKKAEKTPYDRILGQAKLTATRKPHDQGAYVYRSGFSLTAVSKKEDYDLSARTNGTLTLAAGLDAAVLRGAKTGVHFTGSALPPGERTIVLSGLMSLDTAKQSMSIEDLRLEGKAGFVAGELRGSRVFEEDYTWSGPLNFKLDPRRAFGLVDVEIGETRDEKVLRDFTGKLDLAFNAKQAVLSNIDALFDDTWGKGKIRIEDYKTGHSTFELKAGKLDINRYRPPRVIRDKEKCLEPPIPAVRLPLVTLSIADIEGDIQAEELKIFDLAFGNVTAHLTAKDGRLSIPNLRSDFYSSYMHGTFSGTATREELNCAMKLRAVDFAGGDMMVDVSGKQYVDGTANIFFDIATKGATDDEFLANMSGRAGLTITDGSYRFSGEQNPPKGSKPSDYIVNNRTKFQGVGALFRVVDGRFMSDDFKMEATYLNAEGSGSFDLDKNTIDVNIEANHAVVPTVIPIHIYGCLHDPGVSIPSAEIIGNTLKEILGLPLKPFQYLRDLFF